MSEEITADQPTPVSAHLEPVGETDGFVEVPDALDILGAEASRLRASVHVLTSERDAALARNDELIDIVGRAQAWLRSHEGADELQKILSMAGTDQYMGRELDDGVFRNLQQYIREAIGEFGLEIARGYDDSRSLPESVDDGVSAYILRAFADELAGQSWEADDFASRLSEWVDQTFGSEADEEGSEHDSAPSEASADLTTVAYSIIARRLSAYGSAGDEWELDGIDIGEYDWERVVELVNSTASAFLVPDKRFKAAYDRLASRASTAADTEGNHEQECA
ncbi:hypothetical protein [Pseudoclavibacter soli]|uniref:hypothetical protein n=1 Tax=Pseudoclavibacter soli TaxID=452623 RepID=UPI0004187F10|nr:hypothetical protein [Pseudoclavibacter soli]